MSFLPTIRIISPEMCPLNDNFTDSVYLSRSSVMPSVTTVLMQCQCHHVVTLFLVSLLSTERTWSQAPDMHGPASPSQLRHAFVLTSIVCVTTDVLACHLYVLFLGYVYHGLFDNHIEQHKNFVQLVVHLVHLETTKTRSRHLKYHQEGQIISSSQLQSVRLRASIKFLCKRLFFRGDEDASWDPWSVETGSRAK